MCLVCEQACCKPVTHEISSRLSSVWRSQCVAHSCVAHATQLLLDGDEVSLVSRLDGVRDVIEPLAQKAAAEGGHVSSPMQPSQPASIDEPAPAQPSGVVELPTDAELSRRALEDVATPPPTADNILDRRAVRLAKRD